MRPAKVAAGDVGDGLVDAFRQHGFAGASLRTLKEATGLNPASLYHRFPAGKADMASAAIDHAAIQFGALVIDPLRTVGPADARLRSSSDGVAKFYRDGQLACLLATFALSDAPTQVRDHVAATFAMWRTALAGALGDLSVENADDVAADRIAMVQGALILSQSGLGAACFARAVELLGTP